MKKNEMNGRWSTYGRDREARTEVWWGALRERDVRVDGRIILK
jgi:hypothetical protein